MTTHSDHSVALASLLTSYGFRKHALSRNSLGHLHLVGQLSGQTVDILLDTGAASTLFDLNYCRSHDVPLLETGRFGGGAGGVTMPIFSLGTAELTLDSTPLRSDGIFAIDLTHVNQGLAARGAAPVQGIIGADVLLYHKGVIDYVTQSLYLQS